MSDGTAHRRPGDGPVPGRPVQSSGTASSAGSSRACFGIFGHGNVAGVGQALLEAKLTGSADLPYYLARNEQAMVHASAGFARMSNRPAGLRLHRLDRPGLDQHGHRRRAARPSTASRCCCCPATSSPPGRPARCCRSSRTRARYDVSVNDAFRPVSRFLDRINRPEQLPSALLAAMRVLTDPAETGAVTIALPQDVQAEAYDWPEELFPPRVWHVRAPGARARRPGPRGRGAPVGAHAAHRGRRRRHLRRGRDALRRFAEETGIPVSDTQAGKGALPWDHPWPSAASAPPAHPSRTRWPARPTSCIGIGTRYSDFTTASRTAFQHPDVRFVNLNVAAFDAGKHAGDRAGRRRPRRSRSAERGLTAATGSTAYTPRAHRAIGRPGSRSSTRAYHLGHQPLPAQTEVIGVVNEVAGPRDVVVQAAGSLPGDLQMLWRARDPKGYHVEYGYSCMGYEIAGGLGIKLADPEPRGLRLVGDGSYLMMAQEIVTAVSEGIKLTIVLIQNHGFASIGSLSESLGSQRFGTRYRYRNPDTGHAGRRHAAGRPGGQRGRAWVPTCCGRRPSRSSGSALAQAKRPTGPPSCMSRPIRWRPSHRRRAGGTSRFPRWQPSTAPTRRMAYTASTSGSSDSTCE